MAITKYRFTRNIVESTKRRLRKILDDNSYGANDNAYVQVVKTFKKASKTDTPVICVRVSNTEHEFLELGSDTTYRMPLIILDIFAETPGQREDLKDLIISEMKCGWDYEEFKITGGVTTDATVDSITKNGRIHVIDFADTPLNEDVDLDSLELYERYRHRLTFEAELSILEE